MTHAPALDYLRGGRVLITGGTGSLGKKLTEILIRQSEVGAVVIYSRDEFKQYHMEQSYSPTERKRLRFFLGDVRDGERLKMAMERVDHVIHAAALKQVPAAEYNPFEFIKTNVMGAENVIHAALANNVRHVVALSTDKAASPINLYGATKLCSDKLFVAGNNYSGLKQTRFSVVRYGNVVGSRGSVIPFFLSKRSDGELPITDPRMTRFLITLEQGAALVLNALDRMLGGEIWVPRIPSMKVTDIARVIAPECTQPTVGIRPGEKLHEVMVPVDDGRQTMAFDRHLVILPAYSPHLDHYLSTGGVSCEDGFYYGSDNNTEWMTDDALARMIVDLGTPEAMAWGCERGLPVRGTTTA